MVDKKNIKTKPVLDAVLIDPGVVEGLSSFLSVMPVAMLQVGTKPIIQHWMERLSDAGVQNILLLLSHMPDKVRAFVGGGERWGVHISIALVREGSDLKQHLSYMHPESSRRTIISDINVMPTGDFSAWMNSSTLNSHEWLITFPEKRQRLWDLEFYKPNKQQAENIVSPACPSDMYRSIYDLKMLWQINMDMLSGVVVDAYPVGFDSGTGVYRSRNCRVHKTASIEGPVIIGEYSQVGPRAEIGPNVVLGHDVVLDEACTVTHSVIFDRMIIGSYTNLDHVIAAGRMLYKVDSDVLVYINDAAIFSDIEAPQEESVGFAERFLALLMLSVLCMPLMFRALVLKVKGLSVWATETLFLDNGLSLEGKKMVRNLTVTSLAVEHTGWRKLPWLWKVVTGDIALMGITPRTALEQITPEWDVDSIVFPAGVITLADVTGASKHDKQGEDVFIADAYYQASGKRGVNLSLLWRWFFGLWKAH